MKSYLSYLEALKKDGLSHNIEHIPFYYQWIEQNELNQIRAKNQKNFKRANFKFSDSEIDRAIAKSLSQNNENFETSEKII